MVNEETKVRKRVRNECVETTEVVIRVCNGDIILVELKEPCLTDQFTLKVVAEHFAGWRRSQ
jgi:hypothetical protein